MGILLCVLCGNLTGPYITLFIWGGGGKLIREHGHPKALHCRGVGSMLPQEFFCNFRSPVVHSGAF